MPQRAVPRRHLLLAAVLGADVAWLSLLGRVHGWAAWPPLLVALGLHVTLVEVERARPQLRAGLVVAATAAAALAAVLSGPFGSHDLYQYGLYGRIVAFHHANPYLVSPTHFPHDPLIPAISRVWIHSPTTYGPLFTAVSAVVAHVYGGSAERVRYVFQLLAAASLVTSVAVLARRRVATSGLVLVGLAPPMLATVNGGHNDLLAGALALGGVCLAIDRRRAPAGALLGAACAVKLLAAPIALGAVVALVLARRWRDAAVVGAVAGAVLAGGYWLVGGVKALAPLGQDSRATSRNSLWAGVHSLALRAGFHPPAHSIEALVGLVLVGVAGLLVVRAEGRAADPATLAVAFGVAVLLCATYVLPWYSAAVLPAAGMALGVRVQRVALAQASFLLLAYVVPPGRSAALVPLDRLSGPCMAVVAIALLVLLGVGGLRRGPGRGPRSGRGRGVPALG